MTLDPAKDLSSLDLATLRNECEKWRKLAVDQDMTIQTKNQELSKIK